MGQFIDVAPVGEIAPGRAIVVTAWAEAVALFNLDGQVFAIDDACVRCGSSLAAGTLRGTIVLCSGCDWRYDITTGCVNGIPALQVDTFEVKIVGPTVMLGTRLVPRPA
jgi:3-phenylpropionate/trans-cinnamate dioxygenase ferredoxin component